MLFSNDPFAILTTMRNKYFHIISLLLCLHFRTILYVTTKVLKDDPHNDDPKDSLSFQTCKKSIYSEIIEEKDGEWAVTNHTNVKIIEEEGRLIKRTDVGSVRFCVYCPTVSSLDDLWSKYTSGELKRHFTSVMKVDYHKRRHGVPDLYLDVVMDEGEREECRREILQQQQGTLW